MEIIGLFVLLALLGWMMGGSDAPLAAKFLAAIGKGFVLCLPMMIGIFAGLFWLGQQSAQCQNLPVGWACPAPPLFTVETWGWIAIGGVIVTVLEFAAMFFSKREWISFD